MLEHLPHLSGFLNTIVAILVFAGWRAIRRGDKVLHPRLMLAAIATGAAFVVSYVSQTTLLGHARFPGNLHLGDLSLGTWQLGHDRTRQKGGC